MIVRASHISRQDATNEALLLAAIQGLIDRGYIEYEGEFGPEIATFVPFVAWLKKQGLLSDRRVISYRGMRSYYFFLSDEEFEEKPQPRSFRAVRRRGWPSNDSGSARKERWHVCPDYRSHYRDCGQRFDRPVLFVQNKRTIDWGHRVVSSLPLAALDRLLGSSADRFHIVYSRPGAAIVGEGYAGDHNSFRDYPDLDLIRRRHESVEILEETCLRGGADYNRTKLEVLAKTHVFVAVQGGGTHLLACFGNSLLLIFHRRGAEYPHAYASGAYKYLSDPSPLLLIALDKEQLGQGLDVIARTTVSDNTPVVADDALPLVEALRM